MLESSLSVHFLRYSDFISYMKVVSKIICPILKSSLRLPTCRGYYDWFTVVPEIPKYEMWPHIVSKQIYCLLASSMVSSLNIKGNVPKIYLPTSWLRRRSAKSNLPFAPPPYRLQKWAWSIPTDGNGRWGHYSNFMSCCWTMNNWEVQIFCVNVRVVDRGTFIRPTNQFSLWDCL